VRGAIVGGALGAAAVVASLRRDDNRLLLRPEHCDQKDSLYDAPPPGALAVGLHRRSGMRCSMA